MKQSWNNMGEVMVCDRCYAEWQTGNRLPVDVRWTLVTQTGWWHVGEIDFCPQHEPPD
jgi:hypothetical protein